MKVRMEYTDPAGSPASARVWVHPTSPWANRSTRPDPRIMPMRPK